jgi:hypothetical protein
MTLRPEGPAPTLPAIALALQRTEGRRTSKGAETRRNGDQFYEHEPAPFIARPFLRGAKTMTHGWPPPPSESPSR